MGGPIEDEGGRILVAYATRTIDAEEATRRICRLLTARGGPATEACVVAVDRTFESLVIGDVKPTSEEALGAIGTAASGCRTLLTRAGEESAFTSLDAAVGWAAVEPLVARNGIVLGALVVAGELAAREDVLSALPSAGLFAGDVAFELLSTPLLGRKIHRSNNLLAVLAANVDHVSDLVSELVGEPPDLRPSVRRIAEGSVDLRNSAAELRKTLPLRSRK